MSFFSRLLFRVPLLGLLQRRLSEVKKIEPSVEQPVKPRVPPYERMFSGGVQEDRRWKLEKEAREKLEREAQQMKVELQELRSRVDKL